MNDESVDVLIVGAGPVGLTLANDLAARGVSFRIIDELAEQNQHSRAHGLQSRTLEALDALNLAEPMMAAAENPQPPYVLLSGRKVVARVNFDRFKHEPYPYQVLIWQQRVESVLGQALEAAEKRVERSSKLLGFDMDTSGVTSRIICGTGEPDQIRSAWIVGCDGGHSAVRQVLGLKMHGAGRIPERFLIGEVDIEWECSRNEIYQWWHPAGLAATIFIDFNNKWHVLVEHADDEIEQPSLLQKMEQMLQQRTELPSLRLSNPSWIHDAVFYNGMPDKFIVGRAILAGDAAHIHSAAGGQGMNTGIQDALNLGWKLALTVRGAASPALLQSYEAERLRNARQVLEVTRTYHAIQVPSNAFERWFAGIFFRAISTNRMLGVPVLQKVGMLNLHYGNSPLSRQQSRGSTPRTQAGWRIPDVACRTADGATHLFDLIRGTQATLLLFLGAKPRVETLEALHRVEASVARLSSNLRVRYIFPTPADTKDHEVTDPNAIFDDGGDLQSAFGLRQPEILYVRPDGYIGLRTQDLNPDALLDYLASIYA